MSHEEMMSELRSAADPGYEAYQRKIVSDTAYPMLFVRMPVLRKIAKKAARGDWKRLPVCCGFSCYEEVMAVCLGIAMADAPFWERFSLLRPLLDSLDSWGLTDSIAPSLAVKPQERNAAWEAAVECIESEGEYVRRLGIVMLLHFFLEPEYLDAVERVVLSVSDNRYYVQTACAWLLAEIAASDWHRVESVLKYGGLDCFVHNMTIRKIRESLRISDEVKTAAAALRRKDKSYV